MTVPALLLALLLVAVATANEDDSASGMLARLEERRNQFILRGSDHGSSSSDDDDDGNGRRIFASELSGSTRKEERIRERIYRNQEDELHRAAERAAHEAERDLESLQRKPYQAKFTRNNAVPQDCAAATEFVGNSTVNATFVTTCVNLEIGPMIIVGKTSAAPVESDVFDGDLDGKLDVAEALRLLERTNGTKSLANGNPAVNRLSDFLFSIRNRAHINGGSINLTSLVLTGRFQAPGVTAFPINSNAAVAPGFLTFGNGKTLISPCIPILARDDFNLQIVGIIQGFFGLATVAPISASQFFTGAVDPLNFKTGTVGPFNVTTTQTIATTVGGNTLRGAAFASAGTPIGTVVFEPCQAFSYFQ